MKKTLITLAALAMASVAQAATPEDGKKTLEADITDGLWLPAGTTEITVNGTDSYSINAVTAFQDVATYGSYTKEGTGTLTINGNNAGWGTGAHSPVNATVNAGKLVINFRDINSSFVTGTATVNAGATLELTQHETLEQVDVTLNGSEGKTATMQLGSGAYQVMKASTITMNGYTAITGGTDHGLIQDTVITKTTNEETGEEVTTTTNGKIVANGKENKISTMLSIRSQMVMDVADQGELTLTNTIKGNVHGNATAAKSLVKEGAGTLAIAGTVENTIAINVNEGALDLSSVTTLAAASLNLVDGTTLILGDQSVSMSGSLTMAGDITIDLSAWCANVDTEGYTTFTPYMTLFTFTGEDTSFLQAYDGVNVSIKLHDYTTNLGTLKVADNSLQLVPEPTTATLSLLALAGLAARCRRK